MVFGEFIIIEVLDANSLEMLSKPEALAMDFKSLNELVNDTPSEFRWRIISATGEVWRAPLCAIQTFFHLHEPEKASPLRCQNVIERIELLLLFFASCGGSLHIPAT